MIPLSFHSTSVLHLIKSWGLVGIYYLIPKTQRVGTSFFTVNKNCKVKWRVNNKKPIRTGHKKVIQVVIITKFYYSWRWKVWNNSSVQSITVISINHIFDLILYRASWGTNILTNTFACSFCERDILRNFQGIFSNFYVGTHSRVQKKGRICKWSL